MVCPYEPLGNSKRLLRRKKMKSLKHGKSTLKVEVQDVTKQGVWIYIKGKEYFLPHKTYPWFENAKISDVHNLKLLHETHLYWPNLDVDLELESLRTPEKYPLLYR